MIQGWIVHNKIKRVSGEKKVIIGDNIFTVSQTNKTKHLQQN